MKGINLKTSSQKLSLLALLALAGFAVYFISAQEPTQSNSYVEIDGKKIAVELAVTPEQKIKGLSNRSSLGEEAGMLFLFDDKDRLTFWMKDMQFNLDFIWIADDKIVDTHRNVPAPAQNHGSLDVYSPSVPADKVLEVNAGWIQENFGNEDIRGKTIHLITD